MTSMLKNGWPAYCQSCFDHQLTYSKCASGTRRKCRLLKYDSVAQMAFLAAKGAFFLRYLGLIEFLDKQWKAIFGGIPKTLARA